MSEVICDTSPLQYLHQIDQLTLLQAVTRHIIVPTAVIDELDVGRQKGVDLPDPVALVSRAVKLYCRW